MRGNRLSVLFWPIGDRLTASTRYRLLNLLPILQAAGIRATVVRGGKTGPATAARALLLAPLVDCVFLQKKLLPTSYLKVLRRIARRLVFDFDDALYAPRSRPLPEHISLARKMKPKLDAVLGAADLAVVGNRVLAEYTRPFGPQVAIIPTSYDALSAPVKVHRSCMPSVIGWIGSEGTLIYLDMIVPVLARLNEEHPGAVILRVISNAPFRATGTGGLVENITWSIARETEGLLSFDLGVMPLLDDEWSRGKCGFKALQMMAHGLPIVASPIGASCEIVEDGVNGFLAEGQDAWVSRLGQLLASPSLRQTMGGKARTTVLEHYSVERAARSLSSALIEVCRDRTPAGPSESRSQPADAF